MPVQVDETSGLRYVVKRPAENKTYTADFVDIIPQGRTIATVDTLTITAVGNVTPDVDSLTAGTPAASGTQVSAKFDAGDDGEDYEVTIHVTDDAGDEHDEDYMIKVRKAGKV